MARIPMYNAGQPPGSIAQAPATVSPEAFSRPYSELANKVGELSQADQAAYERQRQGVNRLGNLYTENSFYAKQPDSTAKAAMSIANSVQDITGSIAHAAKVKELQDAAIDLGNRKQAATKETLDWMTDARKQYTGVNSAGFTDAAKQKMQEITDKYSQGLSGISLTKFQLYRLSDYETMVKGAASQEAQQHTSAVTDQTNNAITDAVAMGAQASAPEDVDKILTNMGAQIDSLNPNTDNTRLKKQAASKVVDGIVRVMGAQRNFDGANSIISRYKDLNIVNPTAAANLFTIQRQAEAEDKQLARQKEADAKQELHDNQDKLYFNFYQRFLQDPRGFSKEVTPPLVSAMVENKQITPAQGRSITGELFHSIRQSDPYTLDKAGELMASGDLTSDWIRGNSGSLVWRDIMQLQDHVNKQTEASVDAQSLKFFVRDMFGQEIKMARRDETYLQTLHDYEVRANDFAVQAIKAGMPSDRVKAEVSLRFSPRVGQYAEPAVNKLFKQFPATTKDFTPYYEQLYNSAKTMDEDDWRSEWRKLNSNFQIVKEREGLLNTIRQSTWKGEVPGYSNINQGE